MATSTLACQWPVQASLGHPTPHIFFFGLEGGTGGCLVRLQAPCPSCLWPAVTNCPGTSAAICHSVQSAAAHAMRQSLIRHVFLILSCSTRLILGIASRFQLGAPSQLPPTVAGLGPRPFSIPTPFLIISSFPTAAYPCTGFWAGAQTKAQGARLFNKQRRKKHRVDQG
jgi:hypothetical protein